jgi:V/A-type H+-transporting ATPase subunit K
VKDARKYLKLRFVKSVIMVIAMAIIIFAMFSAKAFSQTSPNETGTNLETKDPALRQIEAQETQFALLAASIAFGLGALGAGIAISHVGAAAMGAVTEKPQVAGQALIFVALAEGIVVFGFVMALMILGKV